MFYRRAESKDMQDLVHMMTQTLRMVGGNEVDKHGFGSTLLPEFKFNRKYRDTLVLHGKARQESENMSLGEIPIGRIFTDKLCHRHRYGVLTNIFHL